MSFKLYHFVVKVCEKLPNIAQAKIEKVTILMNFTFLLDFLENLDPAHLTFIKSSLSCSKGN